MNCPMRGVKGVISFATVASAGIIAGLLALSALSGFSSFGLALWDADDLAFLLSTLNLTASPTAAVCSSHLKVASRRLSKSLP
jgi:hypothetical protein